MYRLDRWDLLMDPIDGPMADVTNQLDPTRPDRTPPDRLDPVRRSRQWYNFVFVGYSRVAETRTHTYTHNHDERLDQNWS